MVLTLIFAMLWGGGWADGWKDPRYSLTVQEVVTVPRGLCVLVPCSFSYPRDDWNDQTPAYGYWFIHGTKTNEGRPVATNNLSREVESGAKNRFYLVGNPQENSCTLKIDDPQIRDSRAYHFRIERGKSVRYNFVDNKFYLNVTARTQKPAVYVPETLEPGQQVTAICVFHLDFQQCQAPIFFWTGAAPPSHRISLTSARVSVLTFTPSSEDHGASLTCHVYFPGHHMNFENSVQLNVA